MKIFHFIPLCLMSIFIGCSEKTKDVENNNFTSSENSIINKNEPYTSIVFEVNENEFGYDILFNGKTYIHQPHIPAIEGNKGFSSKTDAEKTAAFIIEKINKNVIPPTVNRAELDSLGVLKN